MKRKFDCILGHIEGPTSPDTTITVSFEAKEAWKVVKCGRCKNFYIKTLE